MDGILTTTAGQLPPPSLDMVPIASLSPELLDDGTTAAIQGEVVLIWPYSSLTRTAALLLADPDPRVRWRKGQVRVRFSNHVARAFADSGVSIGDTVQMQLHGIQWTDPVAAITTPGRSVDGELLASHTLNLNVRLANLFSCPIHF